MTDQISSAAQVWIDNAAGTLTNISVHVTAVTGSGGNELLENTGISDSKRHEILSLSPIGEISMTYKVNTTTEAIFAPIMNGTSVVKTVQIRQLSGKYLYGEANVGQVAFSIPIGLQTGTATFRAADNNGLFRRTSVAQS